MVLVIPRLLQHPCTHLFATTTQSTHTHVPGRAQTRGSAQDRTVYEARFDESYLTYEPCVVVSSRLPLTVSPSARERRTVDRQSARCGSVVTITEARDLRSLAAVAGAQAARELAGPSKQVCSCRPMCSTLYKEGTPKFMLNYE